MWWTGHTVHMSEFRRVHGARAWVRVVIVAVATIVAAGVGAWFLVDPLSAESTPDRASALQATFTLAFGFGGVATLALFARRQWHQERVHEHDRQVAADARHDAEQKRITEQYIKAVEQLGHEKSSVRLGGLYALDRLGRNHPDQRQVVADVWCAYLRQRYTPPKGVLLGLDADDLAGESGAEQETEEQAAAFDEYEVRATAQRLLARHLRDPRRGEDRSEKPPAVTEEYWGLHRIDLTRATLVSMDFRDCVFPKLDAGGLRCFRRARFDGAIFTGRTWLQRSKFHGSVSFDGVDFSDIAGFFGATFLERASFRKATFTGAARFEGADFRNVLDLSFAHFRADVNFDDAVWSDGYPTFLEGAYASVPAGAELQRSWPRGWATVSAEIGRELGAELGPVLVFRRPPGGLR